MKPYEWSTKKNKNYVEKMLTNSHGKLSNGSRLFVKKFFIFTLVILLEPKTLDFVSERTGQPYNIRRSTILIGCIKSIKNTTYYIGLAIFDILDRLFYILITLIGVWYVSNSFISGIILSFIIYLIVSFIVKEKDCEQLRSIKKILDWNNLDK